MAFLRPEGLSYYGSHDVRRHLASVLRAGTRCIHCCVLYRTGLCFSSCRSAVLGHVCQIPVRSGQGITIKKRLIEQKENLRMICFIRRFLFVLWLTHLVQSEITGIFSFSFFFQFTGCNQFSQRTFNGTIAECRAQFSNILLIKSADFILTCPTHHLKCG